MLSKRIIACLDVRNGQVVKGVNFEGLRNAGDPAELAERYNQEGIDEVVILDVTATLEGRRALAATVSAVAKRIFIPLTVGGGIRSEDDAQRQSTQAPRRSASTRPRWTIRRSSQSLRTLWQSRRPSSRSTRSGSAEKRSCTRAADRRAPSARRSSGAKEAADRGAGEILLTSIDRDGTKSGFDCDLTAAVSRAVPIPVIASGGAGSLEHFAEVFIDGCADAALAASIFHFSEHAVRDLKGLLHERGIPVRL